MYPQAEDIDVVSCLEDLVGIRTACPPGVNKPFWIEDLEGVDTKKLATMARASSFKGVDFGTFLIGSAAREMMGDIELLINNGYSLKNYIGTACSNCDLRPVYMAAGGIKIRAVGASNYQVIQITSLRIMANGHGAKQFVIDDGKTLKYFTVDIDTGVIQPVNLEYSTMEREVRIYFTDPNVQAAQVFCPTSSSCGCGGSSQAVQPFVVTGLSAGNDSTTQYGFVPCVTIGCSYPAMICSMIKATPRIFGLALLYKAGEKLFVEKGQSERNNEVVSYGEKEEVQRQFGQLYWAKMKGTGDNMKGIRHIVNNYLQGISSDKCVSCQTKIYSSYVTG